MDVVCDDVDKLRGQENDENSQLSNEFDKDNIFSTNESSTNVLEDMVQTQMKVTGYKDEAGQYQCGKCEKTFSNYQNMYRHNKSTHQGLKFPCNKCNQTFTQNYTLQTHIKSIHEGVTFSCDFCGQVYTQKGQLNAHKKNKH